MKRNNNNIFFLIFIFFLTGFLLGFGTLFIFNEKIDILMGKNEFSSDKNLKDLSNKNFENTEKINLDKYFKAYNIIEKNYYDFDELTEKKIIDGTISGLLSSLGDKHSEYFNLEENSSFTELLDQEFEGIGAVVGEDEKGVKLERIFKKSPAEKAGLLAGDIIISADGVELADLDLELAISHIKGPTGSKVILEIFRQGKKDLLKKEVTRNKVEIPSIESEILEDNIGYINMATFGEKTANEFEKALEKVKNTDGLILDLRENGGGYLDIAVKILSNFVENGQKLVITKTKGDEVDEILNSINSGKIYTGKIVILINENSASASEITAGALRDYNKAILVGKKSYGKGSVQMPFELGDGSMVKITIAKWFTPKNKNIDGEGIEPDIEIDFEKSDYILEDCKKSERCDEDIKQEEFEFYDRQKIEAKKVLKIFIEKKALQLSVDEYKKIKR